MVAYCFVKDPRSWYAYICVCFLAGSGVSVIVSMMAYLSKRLPKMIRGMMVALIAVSSSVGSIIYLQLQKFLTTKYGSFMTFGSIVIIDIIILLILLSCIYLNIYGKDEGGHG